MQGLKTRAVRDGDSYIINGSKIFITNGYLAGLIAVVVKTTPGEGAKGTSIFMVETDKSARISRWANSRQDGHEVAGHR